MLTDLVTDFNEERSDADIYKLAVDSEKDKVMIEKRTEKIKNLDKKQTEGVKDIEEVFKGNDTNKMILYFTYNIHNTTLYYIC